MRYSYTSLALALAIPATQVVATSHQHAARHANHAAFHAKKDAGLPEVKRTDWAKAVSNVDWNEALANVDWSTVSYSTTQGQTWGQQTQLPVFPSLVPGTATAANPFTTIIPQPPTTAEPSTTFTTSTIVATSTASSSTPTTATSSDSDIVSAVLSAVQELELLALGVVAAGHNAVTNEQDVWIGTDGPYTMEVKNESQDKLFLVCWGPTGSWINVDVPLVTLYLPSGSSSTLSFADGASGACSSFYSDTSLVNGQCSNTWIEFTMGEEGVFDISREVNMNGHDVEVVGPKCTSNLTTCVFLCKDHLLESCEYDYELVNCENGSQSGATFGQDNGADSGGCGGLGSSAHMTATFS